MKVIITKASILDLAETSPDDVFSNGSMVRLVYGSICFVITTDGWSAVYKAGLSSEIADDSLFVDTGISGVQWIRLLKADNQASELPSGRLSIREDGILPVGYRRLVHSSSLKNLYAGTKPTALQWAIMGIYNGFVYSIASYTGGVWKVNLSTGKATDLPSVNIPISGACGCISGDYFYIFDTNSNSTTRLDLTSDTWGSLSESIPGPPRTQSVAFFAGGKIYIAGGFEVGTPQGYVYEYSTESDTYQQKNNTIAFAGAGAAVKSSSAIYVVYNYDNSVLKTIIYNPEADTWDISSTPDNPLEPTVTDNNVFYDSVRDQVGVLIQGGSYRVVGLDLLENKWSIIQSVGIDLISDEVSTCFDQAGDRMIHSMSVTPVAGYVNRTGSLRAIKT